MAPSLDLEYTAPEEPDVWSTAWASADVPEQNEGPTRQKRRLGLGTRRPRPWQGLSLAKRRTILHALRTDELLRDPEDAQLLLRTAAPLRRVYEKQRRPKRMLLRIGVLSLLIGQLVYAIVQHGSGTIPTSLAFPTLWVAFEVYTFVQSRKRLLRLRSVEARHLRYLKELGHPVLPENVEVEAEALPVRRELLVSFGLCVASVLLFFVVEEVPLLRDHSSIRLVVYGVIGVSAIALGIGAAVISARSWRRARGFERRSEPAVLFLVGIALAAAWSFGMFNVFFHGA